MMNYQFKLIDNSRKLKLAHPIVNQDSLKILVNSWSSNDVTK